MEYRKTLNTEIQQNEQKVKVSLEYTLLSDYDLGSDYLVIFYLFNERLCDFNSEFLLCIW